jgi:hypothetical protein
MSEQESMAVRIDNLAERFGHFSTLRADQGFNEYLIGEMARGLLALQQAKCAWRQKPKSATRWVTGCGKESDAPHPGFARCPYCGGRISSKEDQA